MRADQREESNKQTLEVESTKKVKELQISLKILHFSVAHMLTMARMLVICMSYHC